MKDIKEIYARIKQKVIEAGYGKEIVWQGSIRFDQMTEQDLLRELAWVVMSSGMKEEVIRYRFHGVRKAFKMFDSAKLIVEDLEHCEGEALKCFNHEGKITAISLAALKINDEGFENLKERIKQNPIPVLQEFKFIGPITSYHLAKNLGIQVAKPDRHLSRMAIACGYQDVQHFCSWISLQTGDPISVVDIVLWRFATIEHDYLKVFK